jgi:hypothetical protein
MSDNKINKEIDLKKAKDISSQENKTKNFLSTIDYNYPSLNRKDLSDLSNINDKSLQFKKLNTNREWSLNLYNLDIEGSSPRKFGFFFNKEDFTNKNSDIEKSSPKSYNKNINKISYNLTNDDIEFSKPQCIKNSTTRHTNPLQPKYTLKNPEILPVTPPKFIRDSMQINDIRGSRPKKIGNEKNLFKEPIIKDIINDSWPRKPYLRKSKYEYLDYRDVTKQNISLRNTNPLRPIYKWSYVDDKKCFGPIDGNYPLVNSKYLYKNPFNLTNKDIEDSNTNSKNRYMKFHGTNYSYNTRDIKGAQGDTVARGIITNRHTNPIVPKYKYLGYSEIQNNDNNPYYTGFQSSAHFNKLKNNTKINFNISNCTFNNNINALKNKNNNYIDDKNESLFDNDKINKNYIMNNNLVINENHKLLEKNIKIIDNKNAEKEQKEKVEYKLFIRSDGKSDFCNFPGFNDKVDFNKNNYKKPEVYFGLSHYQYLLPYDNNKNQIKKNKIERLQIQEKPINKKEMKRRSFSTCSKDEVNYFTKLDVFMNSKNLKYIEDQEQKQKSIINIENNTSIPKEINNNEEINIIEKNKLEKNK